MQKIRSIAFVVVAAFVLCSVLGLKALSAAGVQFPEWAAIGNDRSDLERREYTARPEPTVDSFLSGKFQSQAEKWLSDLVPMRDLTLLASAACQRGCIVLANAPFGFEAYPTHFGSEHVYAPGENSVALAPSFASDKTVAGVGGFLRGLFSYASANPDRRFVVFIPQNSNYSSANPAHPLISDAMTVDSVLAELDLLIGKAPGNVTILTRTFHDPHAYHEEYFRTDHHWNALGTIRAYNEIAGTLGLPPHEERALTPVEGYSTTGSYGRNGLMPVKEGVSVEAERNLGITVVGIDGESKPYGHAGFDEASGAKRVWSSFYDLYYDVIPNGATLINERGEGAALLLCDSYGASLSRHLAEEYAIVLFSKQLHGSESISGISEGSRLDALVEENGAGSIFIVAHLDNLASLLDKCPEYFSVE